MRRACGVLRCSHGLVVLGARVAARLPRLQAEAESLMTSVCTITRGAGGMVYDPETGLETASAGTTVYVGRCRLLESSTQPQETDVAGSTVTISRPELHLPVGAPRVESGDDAQITGGTPAYLVGLQLRIVRDHLATFQTARHCPVELVGA